MPTLPPDPTPVIKHLRDINLSRHIDLDRHLELPFGSLSPHEPLPSEHFSNESTDPHAGSAWTMGLMFLIAAAAFIAWHCFTR